MELLHLKQSVMVQFVYPRDVATMFHKIRCLTIMDTMESMQKILNTTKEPPDILHIGDLVGNFLVMDKKATTEVI